MAALPPLAGVLRYGNVRQTDAGSGRPTWCDGLVARICIGLPGACASLNDEAAAAMLARVVEVNGAVALLQQEEQTGSLAADPPADGRTSQALHGLLAGRCCRLLLEAHTFDADEAARRMGLALSLAGEPSQAAAWVEGFLKGSGLLLLHDDRLWVPFWIGAMSLTGSPRIYLWSNCDPLAAVRGAPMTPEKLDPALDALIETAVAETRAKMRRELAELDLEHATLDEIEEAVEQVGNELQRNLQRRLVAERTRGPRENRQACPACGGPARYRKAATRVITTRHGELAVSRPYYHCRSCAHGFTPLDAALGLEGSALTTQVRLWIAAVAAHLPFAESADLLGRLTQVRVGASTVERSAVATGTALRRAQQEAAARHRAGFPPPTQRQPTRLYISVDGKYVPLRDPWKKDGSAGELVCRFAECKSAIVDEAKTTPAGDVGVARRAYTATMGDVVAFTPLVATLAHTCGHHFAAELVVLGDGAAWIWNLAAAQFPTALEIVDIFHAIQHLYTVAHACFGEGTVAAKAWVEARHEELMHDRVVLVVAAIQALPAQTAEQRKLQDTEAQFFTHNRERMRYGTFRKKGYQIGSGVMEATCKHLVGQRLNQVGMHWREETADAILALRAALLATSTTRPPALLSSGCLIVAPNVIRTHRLWQVLDAWVTDLSAEIFIQLLPLLRRTFSTFPAPERRSMGEHVRRRSTRPAAAPVMAAEFDAACAEAVLPLLARLLGLRVAD